MFSSPPYFTLEVYVSLFNYMVDEVLS